MLPSSYYPIDLFDCEKMDWQVVGGAVEGARSLAADTPDRLPLGRGGLWKCEMSSVFLETPEEYSAWRAIRASLRNGVGRIVVPMLRRPWFAQPGPSAPVPHSDDSTFDDGSGYMGLAIAAELVAHAAHAATTIRAKVAGAEPFIGAEPFTIVHPNARERLYEVSGITEATPIDGGFVYSLEINPPLREAAVAGTVIDFDTPRCAMRLTDSNGMNYEEEIVSFPSVSFIEDLRALMGDDA